MMNEMLAACGPELLLLGTVAFLTLLEGLWPARGLRAKAFFGLAALLLLLVPQPLQPKRKQNLTWYWPMLVKRKSRSLKWYVLLPV